MSGVAGLVPDEEEVNAIDSKAISCKTLSEVVQAHKCVCRSRTSLYTRRRMYRRTVE